jgi:hypothetical protein
MTYKMYASRDLGLSYRIVESDMSSPDIEHKMSELLDEYEKDGVRWVIEDHNGKIVNYCKMFRERVDMLKTSYLEGGPMLFVTDDKKLRKVLETMQDELTIAMISIVSDLNKEDVDA